MKADSRALLVLLLALASAACTRTVQDEDDSDPALKARIDTAIRGDKDVDSRYVSVDVTNGIATISGIAASADQARLIDKLAKRVHGVDGVLDNLLIQE